MSVAVTDYRALISGYNWNGSQIVGKAVVLTYSFWPSLPYYTQAESPTYVSTFAPLNELEKAAVRGALAQWSSVAGITFIESPNRIGDLNFSIVDMDAVGYDSRNVAGLGYYPSASDYIDSGGVLRGTTDYKTGGDVWFGSDFRSDPWYREGLLNLALHEIGHALGLKHPHDVATGHEEVLSPDPVGSTVMSYQYHPDVLGPIDIAAAQYLYGPPGGAGDWTLDLRNERFTFTGTAQGETIRGTAWDDVVYANGGRDIVSTSMGNDRIYVGLGEVFVAGDDGIDIVYSAARSGGAAGISGDTNWSYLRTGGVFQTFYGVEYIVAADGVFSTASKSFVTRDVYDRFDRAYSILVGVDPRHAFLEQAATSKKDIKVFVAELLGSEAKDASIPALVVYDSMLGGAPVVDQLHTLSGFVHDQIFSVGYQATSNPRLGGYEAMGLALAETSSAIAGARAKSDAEFVAKAYLDVFGRNASGGQTTHFVGQVDYFEALYRGAGMSEASAATKARGAVYGQMLGHAVGEAGNPLFAEAEQSLLGFLKGAGVADWMV